MQCSSLSRGLRRRRQLPFKTDASSTFHSIISPVAPTVVRSVSAVASSNLRALTPPSSALASSPQCLSGSTFPDSEDTGYFGSISLYEGSCDHLESYYGRRYSVELVDDIEVFTEWAVADYDQIPVDSVSFSESQNAVPSRSRHLVTGHKEQFVGVSALDADLQSNTATLNDNVAVTSLSDEIWQSMVSPTDVGIPDEPPAAGSDGLSEIAGKYATVQLLLEMNQQRAGLGDAEDLSFGHSSSDYQPSVRLDRKELASLAADYRVICECLQLGRVGLASKPSKAHDSSERGQTITSECGDEKSEQPEIMEISANVTDDSVKDFNADLSYNDQTGKYYSHDTNYAEQMGENVSAVGLSRETNTCKFGDGKLATLVPSGDLGLMYMTAEEARYYPVYGRLKDVETGLLNTSRRISADDAVVGGFTAETETVSDQEVIQRNVIEAEEDKANDVIFSCAAAAAKYLYPDSARPELSVVNYSSLAVLSDVENGNVLSSRMPTHRVAAIHAARLPLVHNTPNVSRTETESPENRVLLDEDRFKDNDIQDDGFTVVKTKKDRKQVKKQVSEDAATQDSTLSECTTSFDGIRATAEQFKDAVTDELHTAEPFVPSVQNLSEAGGEECPLQDFSLEINQRTDETAEVTELEIKTVPLVPAVVADEVVTGMTPDRIEPQRSEPIKAQLDTKVSVSAVAAEGPVDAAEFGHQLCDERPPGDVILADMKTLPQSVTGDAEEALSRISSEPERTEQVDLEYDSTTTEVYIAGITEKAVTNVTPEPGPAVAAVTELAFMKLGPAASESLASASHETIRVERLITVTPRSVVRVPGEPYAEMLSKNIADVVHSQKPAVIAESLAQVDRETTVNSEMEREPNMSVTAVEQVKTSRVSASSEMSKEEVSETFNSFSFSEISDSADAKTKISKVASVAREKIKTEKCVGHYASLAKLGDFESGRVHNRLKASRFLQEWDAENVDDIVTYIVGSEAKKHRRKHRRVKRASESEVSDVRATEKGSELLSISTSRAKSEEEILFTDKRAEKLDAVASDVEEQASEKQIIEESEDDTDDESFTVVESRKHRRLRHRHDAEEMWAQYMEDADAAVFETEQSETKEESVAGTTHGPTGSNTEIVSESVADSSDAESAVALASIEVSNESLTGVPPVTVTDDGQLETVRDTTEAATTDVSPEYEIEAEVIFGHKPNKKLEFSDEGADVLVLDEVCEPVAESVVNVVSQPSLENLKELEAKTATQLYSNESVSTTAPDAQLENTVPVGSGGYFADRSRLYSDVARGKHDVVAVAKSRREITAHVEISVEGAEELPPKVFSGSMEDVCFELSSEAEHQLTVENSSSFLVTSSLESGTDVMADDFGHFVDKCIEDVQTELVSDVIATISAEDAAWPDAEASDEAVHHTEHSLELLFLKPAAELHFNEPAVEQQQLDDVSAVPVVETMSAAKLPTTERDATALTLEVLDIGISAELPPSASDVRMQISSDNLRTAESHAIEAGVESDVLTSSTEISDIGIVSVEERPELFLSQSIPEASSDTAMALPAEEFQSTEFDLSESSVPTLAIEETLVTKEPTVELYLAEDIPVLGHEAVTKDEQRVADLFSEGIRAVQIRSESATATSTVAGSQVEVTHAMRRDEGAVKKSALSSAESFVAEILPYYYAALAVLKEVERDSIQPCDTSLRLSDKTAAKIPHGTSKTNDADVSTVLADDQVPDGVPIDISAEMKKSTAGDVGIPDTISIDSSHCHESAVLLSDSKNELSEELLSRSVRPQAGKYELQTLPTTSTTDKQGQLDRNRADVVALQSHYQSLKLLHSVETGNLPAFSSHMTTVSDRTYAGIKGAPAVSSVKPPTDDTTDSFAFTSLHEAPGPSRDSLEDVPLEDDEDVSMCVHVEHREPRTASSKQASTDLPAAEELTPVIALAENRNVEISSADDFSDRVLSPTTADHTERKHSNILATGNVHDVSVTPECDHAISLSSSNLLTTEPISELPIQTADDATEIGVRESQPHVLGERNDRDNGCMNKYTAAVRDTDDFTQSSMIEERCSLPEETDLTEELLVPDIIVREVLTQQQVIGARQTEIDQQHSNQEASCSDEQPPSCNNIGPTMYTGDTTLIAEELTDEKAKRKRKNRKKKPKSLKDDLRHAESSLAFKDPPFVNQSDIVSEILTEPCSAATVEAGSVDDNSIQISSTSVPAEARDGETFSTPKKTKKRKRTKKKAGQVVVDNATVENSVSEHITALPVTISEAEHGMPDADESAPTVLSADETVMPNEENYDYSKPDEMFLDTQSAGFEVSKSIEDGESAKPTRKKNRKKRKPKTNHVPSTGVSVRENEMNESCVSLDNVTQNDEKLDVFVVPGADELMSESLEENAKITDQPLDILSVKNSKEMSEPSSFSVHAPLFKTAAKKKKKRKLKPSKIVQPSVTAFFVSESSTEEKDGLPEKDEIIGEGSALNFTPETLATDLSVATLTVTTKELDNTNVSVPLLRDEDWIGAEKETRFEVGSSGESSLDEYQLNVSHATKPAADDISASESFEKRKKRRKRNRQKKSSHQTTRFDAETATDVYSLLTRIIEICSDAKDSQTAAGAVAQTQSAEHDTNASQSVQAAKTARKPRKYKRSKPIRLPPDVAEHTAEQISYNVEKTDAVATFPAPVLQSEDTLISRIKPTTQLCEETGLDLSETLTVQELPSQLESAVDVNIESTDTTVTDDPNAMQNAEETNTIIAWTVSSAKTSNQISELLWPRSLPDQVVDDPQETQPTDVTRTPTDIENTAVTHSNYPLDDTYNELQQTCLKVEPQLTSEEHYDVEINQKNPQDIAGCLTADVFTVILENTNATETTVTVGDEDIAQPQIAVTADDQRLPDADDDSIEILDQNSNPAAHWLDGGGLQQAALCETSSVDSEVERIFANPVADDDDVDDLSAVEEGAYFSDSGKYVDDGGELDEDEDVVITEYVDVEIIEETETVTVLDSDDDFLPSVSDRRRLDTVEKLPEPKYVVSGVSATGHMKETTGDAMPFQPYSFRLHDDKDKHQLAGSPLDVDAEDRTAFAAHGSLGQKFCPQRFSNYSAAGDRPTFHWPPTPPTGGTEVLGSRIRLSRKRQYPSDDTSSSDSSDNKQGPDNNSQFILSHHQPAPVWPFLPNHAQWSAPDDVIDAGYAHQNLAGEPQVAGVKPSAHPWQNVSAAVPTDFDFAARSTTVTRRDFPGDDEEISGDSLNGDDSGAVDSFFEEPKLTFAARTTVSSDQAHESVGETCETCSTDSLDCQTRTEPRIELSVYRRSSMDYISEDSLVEESFVAGKSSGSTVNRDTAASSAEQRRDTGHPRVNVRRKKAHGVSARFKCPKPGGVAVRTSRKRKLGNVEKSDSDDGDSDTDSEEPE